MNPVYAQLRQALVSRSHATDWDRHRLTLNLERARALPPASPRYVVVNTASQRLYMFENGKLVDQMKVVAGRANAQTPLINAYIRFAVLNPYWNVPADIVARLAPNVVKRGSAYLKEKGYEVVSDHGDQARIIDAATIDWQAVASGKIAVQLRQLPGGTNSMGRIKFMFPNSQGVWLHDTPSRGSFGNDLRLDSNGCIRLEDAWRLGSWLFERPLRPTTREPERKLGLPAPVPVYITYLTAMPRGSSIEYVDDIYSRDTPPLVQAERHSPPASAAPASIK
jgi:murein L,D-transpeptidase YcbB/YkuD